MNYEHIHVSQVKYCGQVNVCKPQKLKWVREKESGQGVG
jgi:hypothetical protein